MHRKSRQSEAFLHLINGVEIHHWPMVHSPKHEPLVQTTFALSTEVLVTVRTPLIVEIFTRTDINNRNIASFIFTIVVSERWLKIQSHRNLSRRHWKMSWFFMKISRIFDRKIPTSRIVLKNLIKPLGILEAPSP